MARIAGRFRRVEPRRRARAYVLGLLSPLAGKNGWTLAEAAGENTPDGMQRLLNTAVWDADAVRDDLRDYVAEHLGDADAILIIDETGFLKKGTKSAGVQRQYSGTAGRTENCQLGVFLAYASAQGRTLVDRELYLPQGWCADDARRTEAAVPAKVRFATKPALGLQMLRRALDAGLPARWVTADEAYGKDSKFRLWLQGRRMGYVLAVACNQKIPTDGGSARADELAAAAPAPAWKRRSCGEGAKGPRLFDWAVATLPDTGTGDHGFTRWLLIRRSITDPTEHAYYLCYGPADTNDEELIRVAGARWAIEECFQTAKGQVGLDDYQVRRYDAWYRHITLAMCAHAFLAVTAAQAQKGAPPTGPGSSPSASPRLDVSWHT
ncbi:SRSO17 transposase [Micromonospora rhizosphaerae]|uniref:SRSO17 transposase n=1 Tax=Micromonospora rhizosphaerae TaxID=568872 RepID=A0A1C6S111_9ACTN|nr:SRSO17 transposase [Micromonospora rhizosphaerae]